MRMALKRAFCLQCVTHLLFLDTRPAVQHRPEAVKADKPLIRQQALHSSRKQIDAYLWRRRYVLREDAGQKEREGKTTGPLERASLCPRLRL